ncbi:MAG: TMEM165/GDT1 family protein [Oligoflexia bacterium]|nr:TMEM165/GDT1 family protein [Oligoflexia bacterium]
MDVLLNSTLLVTLSEMGDKTQLLAFSLATRFKRPWVVMAGIFVATVLNHALASSVGSWISTHIPAQTLALVLGVTFILFGLWTLKPDTLEEGNGPSGLGAFAATTVLFFLAEMGDKTQLATVALAAKYQSILWVTTGTTLGMLISDGLAVFAGEALTRKISMQKLRWAAAGLFFLFGGISLWSAWGLS